MSNLSIETHKSIVIYELMTTAVGFTGEVAIEYWSPISCRIIKADVSR